MATSKKDTVDKTTLIENRKFRRSNKAVGMRVSEGGTLTLLCRKIFNVVMFHTQKLGVPGENAPTDAPQFQKYYWVLLSAFVEDVRYNSQNIEYLAESFNSLLNIKLYCDDAGGVGGESLLAGFRISNQTGKRGDPRWIGWALPPGIEQMAMNPLLYTNASLFYLSTLKSNHSLGLYETCKRYATSPGGLTMRKPVAWWHDHLRGLPVGTDDMEYKIFKRNILKKAIEETNLMTDIDVELIEVKNGRKITDLQFRVSEKAQAQLLLPHEPVLNMEIIDRLVLLGFAKKEAEDVLGSNTEEFVTLTLTLVENRMADNKLSALVSGAAFFRSAIKNRYVETSIKAKKAAVATAAAKRKSQEAMPVDDVVPIDPIKEAARIAAMAKFDGLDKESQEVIINQAAEENSALSSNIKKNPNGKIARSIIATLMMANIDGQHCAV